MNHPWFREMDWNALLSKSIPPPFTPNVSDEGWLNNFDKDFTGMSKLTFFVQAILIFCIS